MAVGVSAAATAAREMNGFLAELAPVGDPTQLPSVVAVALGVRDQSGEPLRTAGEARYRLGR